MFNINIISCQLSTRSGDVAVQFNKCECYTMIVREKEGKAKGKTLNKISGLRNRYIVAKLRLVIEDAATSSRGEDRRLRRRRVEMV